MSSLSGCVGFSPERARLESTFNGTFQTLGSVLDINPAIMIIDNQTLVSVALSVDGVNVWKTFSPGEGLVLDLRGNHGIAANYTVDLNTQFYVNGAAGAGTDSFRISILYAR